MYAGSAGGDVMPLIDLHQIWKIALSVLWPVVDIRAMLANLGFRAR